MVLADPSTQVPAVLSLPAPPKAPPAFRVAPSFFPRRRPPFRSPRSVDSHQHGNAFRSPLSRFVERVVLVLPEDRASQASALRQGGLESRGFCAEVQRRFPFSQNLLHRLGDAYLTH